MSNTPTLAVDSAREKFEALREALAWYEQFSPREGEGHNERFERIGDVYYRETGWLRPGKSMSMESGHSMEEQQAEWDEWLAGGHAKARAALALPAPEQGASDAEKVDALPTEQQILEAATAAGLWPNTIYSWLPAFHRYHKLLRAAMKDSP